MTTNDEQAGAERCRCGELERYHCHSEGGSQHRINALNGLGVCALIHSHFHSHFFNPADEVPAAPQPAPDSAEVPVCLRVAQHFDWHDKEPRSGDGCVRLSVDALANLDKLGTGECEMVIVPAGELARLRAAAGEAIIARDRLSALRLKAMQVAMRDQRLRLTAERDRLAALVDGIEAIARFTPDAMGDGHSHHCNCIQDIAARIAAHKAGK